MAKRKINPHRAIREIDHVEVGRRAEALGLAVDLAKHTGETNNTSVIADARAFYDFLSGKVVESHDGGAVAKSASSGP